MQGFNMGRYYPPDASNAPSFNTSSHPLGKRAAKISQGILTVRFELPFALWCSHCTPPAIVGQGVRFNAEKKKVGNYHSTPIWSFRMKHSACGGWWEIKTDPQKSEYVVVEGARRRDYGPDDRGAEADGDLKFLTEEEKEKRRNDAFAQLEGNMEEKVLGKKNKERVEELYDQSEVWRDSYEANARLRKDFRVERKVRKREDRHKEGLQDKFSLGIEIADETATDRMRAGLIEFGGNKTGENKIRDATWKPLFAEPDAGRAIEPPPKTKRLKSELVAEKNRKSLQHTLVGNTKATIDPFLSKEAVLTLKPNFGILKRKKGALVDEDPKTPTRKNLPMPETATKPPSTLALVGYDSD